MVDPPFPIGHLYKPEQDRIREGRLNQYEREMLTKNEDPWAKFLPKKDNTSPEDPRRDKDSANDIQLSLGDSMQKPRGLSLELEDDASHGMEDKVVSPETSMQIGLPKETLRKRALNRFWLFRKLMEHPKLSEGGGITLSFVIAKQALDYQISGAVKTAAFVFLLAWAAFALAIYISSFWDKRRPLMMVLLIVTALGLFTVWWAYLPLPLMPPNSQRSASIATLPIPTPTTSSSVMPQAQTSDDKQRILIDVKPEYLIGLYKKYSTAQANQAVKTYIGKWVKISGEVVDVDQDANWDALVGRVDPSVMITTKIPATKIPADYFDTHCRFEEQRLIDRALVLRRGEKITLFGRITRITEQSFSLEKCEFVE
jgi:hypothetical protein